MSSLHPPAGLAAHEAVRSELDGRIAIASWGPVDVDPRSALARQFELLAPAKLVLSREGVCEVRAEVPRVGDVDATQLARTAVDTTRAWLACSTSELGARARGRDARAETSDLGSALDALPTVWAWDAGDAGSYRIHATAFGESARLRVETVGEGARVSARSTLVTSTKESSDAVLHFVLECNRRIRLARIGLGARDESDARALTWDWVTPPEIDLADALPVAVEAVAFARAATRRSLHALCHLAIADRYLGARASSPRRRRALPSVG